MSITNNDKIEISKLRSDLSLRFEMKVLGELNIFLGLEVMNTKECIFISQTSYGKKNIIRFEISKSKKVSTSFDANIKLSGNDRKILFDPRFFCALIGSLIYLIIIRLYITFSVGLVNPLCNLQGSHILI